jgi:methanogenic corrinoid protein MtbC1
MASVVDQTLLTLLLAGDRRRAEGYAHRLLEGYGVRFLYEEAVRPALEEVGRLWHAHRITVADEHLATATAQSAIAALYPAFRWPPPGPRVLVACAEGERHDFGARMVADLLAMDGWEDRFLGADVPAEDLARKVQELAPRAVGISITLPVHLPTAHAAIRLIREVAPRAKIMLGGRATTDHPDLASSFEADAIPGSGAEAVEVARAWK